MKMKHSTKLVCSIVLCGVVSSVALAERRERPERLPSTGILPVVQGVATLTLSGEGYWQQHRYQDGQQPSLDDFGGNLPYGIYHYEYVALPEVAVAADAAPETTVFVAAGGEERPARIESGSFTMSSAGKIFN
jgi:hypothetical protein